MIKLQSKYEVSNYPGGKSGLTDMVCYKKLLCMVGFLRPPATTSGWTTFPAGYCNFEIQDGVHILKSPYYHRLFNYYIFMCNTSFLWFSRSENLFMIAELFVSPPSRYSNAAGGLIFYRRCSFFNCRPSHSTMGARISTRTKPRRWKSSYNWKFGELRSRDAAIAINFVALNGDKLAWNAFILCAGILQRPGPFRLRYSVFVFIFSLFFRFWAVS